MAHLQNLLADHEEQYTEKIEENPDYNENEETLKDPARGEIHEIKNNRNRKSSGRYEINCLNIGGKN